MTGSLFAKLPPLWETSTLGDVCERTGGGIQTGPFGSQLHASDYVPVGMPAIMPQNLVDGGIDTSGIARIRPEDAVRLSRYLVRPGDIVYSRRGDVTKRALVAAEHEGWLCATGCLRIRLGGDEVLPRFAYYYLGHPAVREWISRHAIGATLPNLNTSILSALPFVVPPKPEQGAIATMLGALDDKITLSRQTGATLETLARAIFKSWFADFAPVRSKAEGRYPAGMNAKTAALFPNAFKDSELGRIPKGWKVACLREHVEAVKGLSYKGDGLSASGMPLHNLNSILEGGGYKYEGIKFYSGEYKDRHLVRPGDLVVANTEQGFDFLLIGYPAIVPRRFGRSGIFSHHLYVVRPRQRSSITTQFLYHVLMTPLVRDQVVSCTNGTTVNMLSSDGLESPRLVLPPDPLIQKFTALATAMNEKAELNGEEAATLAALRDTLLPKLIAGEIRLKDAEKTVGAAI